MKQQTLPFEMPLEPLRPSRVVPLRPIHERPIRDERFALDELRRQAKETAIAVVEVRRLQLVRAEQLLQRLVQHG
jgi:hypothetical protein